MFAGARLFLDIVGVLREGVLFIPLGHCVFMLLLEHLPYVTSWLIGYAGGGGDYTNNGLAVPIPRQIQVRTPTVIVR